MTNPYFFISYMVSVILKIVLGEKNHFRKKKKKFILNTPIFGQYCGITHLMLSTTASKSFKMDKSQSRSLSDI